MVLPCFLSQILPVGLSGLISMVQNWTFTLFYIAAELWGDVGLSLLFWGLANEVTSHDEAPMLYPLFGVGANVAQVPRNSLLCPHPPHPPEPPVHDH